MILKRKEKENIVKALYDSSNILGSTYNSNTGDLTLIFKAGTQYKYSNVSKSDYMRFEIAESQGVVFNTHIKKYSHVKLDNIDTSNISIEADDLKNQEQVALIEAKRLEVVNRIKYLAHIDDTKQSNKEWDALFLENLNILKTNMDDYFKELNNGDISA
jgi:hypothetical protein